MILGGEWRLCHQTMPRDETQVTGRRGAFRVRSVAGGGKFAAGEGSLRRQYLRTADCRRHPAVGQEKEKGEELPTGKRRAPLKGWSFDQASKAAGVRGWLTMKPWIRSQPISMRHSY